MQNGLRLQKLANSAAIRQCFTEDIAVGEISHGYLNRDSGWADAGKATLLLTQKVIALGGKVISGKRCVKLVRKDGKTEGVECHDGTIVESSLVILATGPWSPSVFPELEYKDRSHATG
jgi:sarcosine oxidase/L-pipecolate oxidase